jgi:hypothetical protein
MHEEEEETKQRSRVHEVPRVSSCTSKKTTFSLEMLEDKKTFKKSKNNFNFQQYTIHFSSQFTTIH